MTDTQTSSIPPPPPNIEVTSNDLASSSGLSSSVERLVEVTRRLTVCNQLQCVLTNQGDELDASPNKGNSNTNEPIVPSEVQQVESSQPSPTQPDTLTSPEISSATDSASSEDISGRSPINSTKKWARLLGIPPEDIGDEEEFIVSFLFHLFLALISFLNAVVIWWHANIIFLLHYKAVV